MGHQKKETKPEEGERFQQILALLFSRKKTNMCF